MKKVFVGLSGGVDSSVSAALLVEQGYDVTGVYMKNWSKDLPGFPCPWKEDYQDAKRIAVKLGIPFEMFDFEKEYFEKVVQYMIDGYSAGLTPNPDIMCNQEIKFKLFYEVARERGADFIATGHYARVGGSHLGSQISDLREAANVAPSQIQDSRSMVYLQRAADENKDQTYFLYRMPYEALQHTLFPIGHLTKPQVRAEAEKRGLITAHKKESMGICFVGKVGIREFLSQYVKTEPGPIVEQHGLTVGRHDGAIFYTIGQRHGLDVGGGLPYYVIGKDMTTNTVYVTNDISDESLWTNELQLTSLHWIQDGELDQLELQNRQLLVRTRHRAALIACKIKHYKDDIVLLQLEEKIRASTPGQSAVLYTDSTCLGGGIIV